MAKQVKERKPVLYNAVAAEQVASALLADTSTIGRIRDLMNPDDVPASLDRVHYVFKAAWELDQDHKVVNMANVSELLLRYGVSDIISYDYLYDIDKRGYRSVVDAVEVNAKIVNQHAVRRNAILKLSQAMSEIETNERDVNEVMHEVNEDMQKIITVRNDSYNPSYADYDYRNVPKKKPSAKTHLWFFNAKTGGGLAPSKIHSVVSPPKQRKTTFLRNLALPLLVPMEGYEHLYGAPITWFTVDGTFQQASNALHAISASYIMCKDGVNPDDIQIRESWVSSENEPRFTKEEYLALEKVRKFKKNARLNIYDTSTGMNDLGKLQNFIHRDYLQNHAKAQNEGFPSILIIDFIQRIRSSKKKVSWNDSDFELAVQGVVEVAQYYGMTAFILSQPASAAYYGKPKAKFEDKEMPSKGGAALRESCDFEWSTDQPEDDPNSMFLQLLVSRDALKGEMQYNIIPSSGLFINPSAGKHDYSAVEGY